MSLKSPDPGRFTRKPAKANPTEGFAHPKPTRKERKPPKRLQSKGRIERHTWMKQRREKPRRGPWRSPEHRAAVRKLPCCAPGAPYRCSGRMTCSHLDATLEEKGMGMKTGDQNSGPMCMKHGADWDLRAGPFRGWTKEERAVFAFEAIHETLVVLGLRDAA